jgi:hypothetical protein
MDGINEKTNLVFYFPEEELTVDGLNEKVARAFFGVKLPTEKLTDRGLALFYQENQEDQDAEEGSVYWRLDFSNYEISLTVNPNDSSYVNLGKQNALEFFNNLFDYEQRQLLNERFLNDKFDGRFDSEIKQKIERQLNLVAIENQAQKNDLILGFQKGIVETLNTAGKTDSIYQMGKLRAKNTAEEVIKTMGEEVLLGGPISKFLEKINFFKDPINIKKYNKGFSNYMCRLFCNLHLKKGESQGCKFVNELIVLYLNQVKIEKSVNRWIATIEGLKIKYLEKYHKDGLGKDYFQEFMIGVFRRIEPFLLQLKRENSEIFKGSFPKTNGQESQSSIEGGGEKEKDIIEFYLADMKKIALEIQAYMEQSSILLNDITNANRDKVETSLKEDFDWGQFMGYKCFVHQKIGGQDIEKARNTVLEQDILHLFGPLTGEISEETQKKLEAFKQGFKEGLEKGEKILKNSKQFRLKQQKNEIIFLGTKNQEQDLKNELNAVESALHLVQSDPDYQKGYNLANLLYNKYIQEGKEEDFLGLDAKDFFYNDFAKGLWEKWGYTETDSKLYTDIEFEQTSFKKLQNGFCDEITILQQELEDKYQEPWINKGREFALKFIKKWGEEKFLNTAVSNHLINIEEIYQESFEKGIEAVMGDIHFKRGKKAAEVFFNKFSKGKTKKSIIDTPLKTLDSLFLDQEDIKNKYQTSYIAIHGEMATKFYKAKFILGGAKFLNEKLNFFIEEYEQQVKSNENKTVDELLKELEGPIKKEQEKPERKKTAGGAVRSKTASVPAPSPRPEPRRVVQTVPNTKVKAAPANGPLPQTKEQRAARQREKVANQKIADFKYQVNLLANTSDLQLMDDLKSKIKDQEQTAQRSEGDFKTVNERILQEYKNAFEDVEKYLYENRLSLNDDLRATIMKLCLQDNKKERIKFQDKYNEIQVQTLIVCLLYLIREGKLNVGRPAELLAKVEKKLDQYRAEDVYLDGTKAIVYGLKNKTLSVEKVLADAGFSFWI